MALPAGSSGKARSALASSDFPDIARHFSAQVSLYKQLAMSAWNDALSKEKAAQENEMAAFSALDRILEAELRGLSKADFTKPGAETYDKVAALAVFMYLLDKAREMHRAVLAKNKIGLYSLFGSARKSIHKQLSGDYFRKPLVDIVKAYMLDEPLYVACAELAGVELVAIQDMVPLYQPKVADRVTAIMEGKKPSKKK
jgi:hypothetical protein